MAKKVNKLFRKTIISLFNFLGAIGLTSCIEIAYGMIAPEYGVVEYGMPPNYRSVQGTVRGPDTDGDGIGEPIPGIQYSYNGMTFETLPVTDEDGRYYVDLWDEEESVTISFKDIDGEANGSFEDRDVTVSFDEENYVYKDIDLTSK